MFVDYVTFNGEAGGEVGRQLQGCYFDPGLLRPYFNEQGVPCVTLNTGRMVHNKETGLFEPQYREVPLDRLPRGVHCPVANATTLRKDQWIEIDRMVQTVARPRLKAWADLAASSTYSGFNGMAKTAVEYESVGEAGEAFVDMDPRTPGRTDAPEYGLHSTPLPVIHSDFWFSARRIAASQNAGGGLDLSMGEYATRRVAEKLEKMTIGVEAPFSVGGLDSRYSGTNTVYGMINFPDRLTYVGLTIPNGTNSDEVVKDVIAMREALYAQNFYGPFRLYHTPAWDAFMDQDYKLVGGNVTTQTLRQRLEAIKGIDSVQRLDFWNTGPAFQMSMAQMTSDVGRAIIGMDFTTVQWPSSGGLQQNFKVMVIMVPQYRTSGNGDTGLLHAIAA